MDSVGYPKKGKRANAYNPLADKPGVLTRAEVVGIIDPAREHVVGQRHAAPLQPRQQPGTRVLH